MHQSTQSADGTTIAYVRLGDGPPVVVVDGAFQHRAFDPRTAALTERLAERFTVLHYDRRGRGGSGDAAGFDPARELEDLGAVLAAAGGEAGVFGHSSGGVLALDAAAQGLPITRLALYEPPFVVDGSRPPAPADLAEQLAALVAEERRGDAVERFLTAGVGLPPEMVGGMRHAPVWPGFEALAHTLPYDAALTAGTQAGDPGPLQRFAGVATRALVLDGGASPDWARAAARAAADVLPNAERRTLDGQDHGPEPDVLAPVLARFFAA